MYNYSHSGKPNTRIDVADILRGIAIGGIILIHFIEHMNFYSFPEATSAFWAKMNQAVWDSTFFLLAGKMYAIFTNSFQWLQASTDICRLHVASVTKTFVQTVSPNSHR